MGEQQLSTVIVFHSPKYLKHLKLIVNRRSTLAVRKNAKAALDSNVLLSFARNNHGIVCSTHTLT